MSKILVTGACGFIGSNLVDALLSAGHSVTGIDSLTSFYSKKTKLDNIKSAMENRNFTFCCSDICSFDFKKIKNDIEYIFHLAAEPGVRSNWVDSFPKYTKNNIMATQHLLESFVNTGVKRFIFTSSSSVYGKNIQDPMAEEMPLKPFSPYAVTKLASENLCGLYHYNFNFPVIILRIFSAFGKRQRPDMAFAKIIDALKNDTIFEIYGEGIEGRDYTYIDNIIDALILAMNYGEPGNIFNIGSGSSIQMNEIIDILSDIAGKKVKVKYLNKVKGDVDFTLADISKAKNQLGYRPFLDLKNQIRIQFENHRIDLNHSLE
jgi:nucleoside-diphosphate-sugar epimerase